MGAAGIDDAVDSIAVNLPRIEFESKFLLHHAREEAANRVLLPAGCLHHRCDGRAGRGMQHFDHASLLRALPTLFLLIICGRHLGWS